MSSVRLGLAAPTPNEIIEGERDRQGSISLLRRRAFEESARQQKDRESAIHHELQAAQAELSSLRNKLADEQARAQVIAGTMVSVQLLLTALSAHALACIDAMSGWPAGRCRYTCHAPKGQARMHKDAYP